MCLTHPNSGCMAYGMLPADIMNILDNVLWSKINELFAPDITALLFMWEETEQDPHDTAEIDRQGHKLHAELMHTISSGIISLASKSGVCIV